MEPSFINRVVRVQCGSAHVRGKARNYRYVMASLFVTRRTKSGHVVWHNTGISGPPRRSFDAATRDALALAAEHGASVREGYGSLHNRRVRIG